MRATSQIYTLSLHDALPIFVPPDRIPVRGAYAVKSVTIDATVRDQVAEVQLSQVFRNLSSRDMEVTYVFPVPAEDRKSTRLNSSHSQISYAVFCLKKNKPTR